MTNKILYVEAHAGISGDMTVAALLDLGADAGYLQDTLHTLPLEGYEIAITRVKKAGLFACDFDVRVRESLANHDHDMEYLYGHEHEHDHGHNHDHEHEHGHGAHVHRNLREVTEIIDASQMTAHAKEIAHRIFAVLAEAEAKVHGATKETVHFHEVGAIDSIVDIAAVAICIDNLGITKVITSPLCEGSGTVRCAHGILPIPVPAVAAIAENYRLPLQITSEEGERITPTGAAIVAALRTDERLPETMVIEKTGIGAGKRTYERPSILRMMLVRDASAQKKPEDTIMRLECNLDDCTGEALGYVMNELFSAGARDVHYTPVYMKKNRPGYELTVICDPDKVASLEQLIFAHTTTIGIRRCRMERTVLPRRLYKVNTPWGEAGVKEVTLPDGTQRAYPEHEDVARIVREHNLTYQEVYRAVVAAAGSALTR